MTAAAPAHPDARPADPEQRAWLAYLAEALAWEARWPEPVYNKCDEELRPLGPIEWRDW